MVYEIPIDRIVFPDPEEADDDGLLGIGGDLSVERLLVAYTHGIFPWFNEQDPICWYSPSERCVIYPDRIKISKSMRKVLKDGTFRISINEAFRDVIACCAGTPRKEQDGTWITSQMQDAYIALHEEGYAQSIEVWSGDQLVGGLYGLEVNGVFCGESMFSLQSNASKAALIWLSQDSRYRLIDCQIPNTHLLSMGAELITRHQYLQILHHNYKDNL